MLLRLKNVTDNKYALCYSYWGHIKKTSMLLQALLLVFKSNGVWIIALVLLSGTLVWRSY